VSSFERLAANLKAPELEGFDENNVTRFHHQLRLLFSGFDDGRSLDQETLEKMFHCEAKAEPLASVPSDVESRLAAEAERHVQATISRSLETNNRHFQEAREKLEKWADDLVLAAEKELKDTKERIKALTRQARLATTTEEQHTLQKQIQELEKQKRRQRQRIFDVEDEIMAKRDELIERLEKRMRQRTNVEPLFTIRWSVV
jgi:chromosome segregation ATPase